MHTNQRAGALPVQIEIADMKLSARAMELCFISAVNRTRQTKLRIVRDFQCIVVVLCLDHREHWSKNLFLLDRRTWLHVRDYSRLDKEPLLAIGTAANQNPATFTLSFFDVGID